MFDYLSGPPQLPTDAPLAEAQVEALTTLRPESQIQDPVQRTLASRGHIHSQDYGQVNTITVFPKQTDVFVSDKPTGSLFVVTGTDGKETSIPSDASVDKYRWLRYLQTAVLLVLWLGFTVVLITREEKLSNTRQLSVSEGQTRSYWILQVPPNNKVLVVLDSYFLPTVYRNMSTRWMTVWFEQTETNRTALIRSNLTSVVEKGIISTRNVSASWVIPLVTEDLIDHVPLLKLTRTVTLTNFNTSTASRAALLRLQIHTNLQAAISVAVEYNVSPIDTNNGVIYATLVLCGLYFLIIFETIDRTLAAMLASTTAVALLALSDERPSMGDLISWIDAETLLLLFSMMILVAILSETGIFDYLAVYAYKITGGSVWPFVGTLCLFTALLSSVLDNVTTVLLMTPVTIRLCEVMQLNPVPVLTTMIIYSNIGGSATPVGDPPNAIIASNAAVIKAGVDFANFTLHMGVAALLVGAVTYVQLRFLVFRNINDLRITEPQEISDARREIIMWERAASSLSSYSKDEDAVKEKLLQKARTLSASLARKITTPRTAKETYEVNLEQLQAKYPIRDKVLLVKSGLVLVFVVGFFFLHSIPGLHLSLAWTALLGAILLLIVADNQHMEEVLTKVEWNTLLFFAALFILMESLSHLGLLEFIGHQVEAIILSVGKSSRLAVAIMLVLWVSAISSAFIDNIPLTTMMIRIVTSLSENPDLGLPMQPLVWALACGACLGGVIQIATKRIIKNGVQLMSSTGNQFLKLSNGTLIGASANVVCSGVAEQHGYKFSFIQYFKIGFPVMIVSIVVVSVYLYVAHVVFTWH